jgi:2-polyprenyl-3-methyl-5-hydroxy-6-metoxy-1,4-benzoquinol methylase
MEGQQHTGIARGRAVPCCIGDTSRVMDPADAAGACALCGRPGTTLHNELGDRLFDAPGTFSLRSCTKCSLVWLDPMPRAEDASGLYDSYYTHDDDPAEASWFQRVVTRGIPAARMGVPECADPTQLWLGQILSLLGPLREIAEHSVMWLPVSRRGRVLDVGCGSGSYLLRMRDCGWDVSGVEPDPKARNASKRQLGEDAHIVATLDDPSLKPGSFTAVTLSHVIEHVPDPVATLRACHRLLAPGGLLACVTPNTASLGARSFGPAWLHWDPPRHLHLFDPDTLTRVVGDAGFVIERCTTPGSSAHFVWQASALLERQRRLPGARVSGVSPTLWLESIGFWALEYALTLAGRRCGEEVLVMGQKPAAAVTHSDQARDGSDGRAPSRVPETAGHEQ